MDRLPVFDSLIVVVFAAHLLSVNVAAAGPLIAVAAEWLYPDSQGVGVRTARHLAAWSLAALVLGVLLGIVLAVLLWSGEDARRLHDVLGARFYWGIGETLFSLVLHGIYWGLWRFGDAAEHPARRWGSRAAAILSATNLLYHFPPLFAIVRLIVRGAVTVEGPLTSADYRALVLRGDVLAISLHVWLASLAVAAVAAMTIAWNGDRGESAEELNDQNRSTADDESLLLRRLAGLALVTTLLQVPIGVWVLVSLAAGEQQRLLGGNLLGTGLFGASIAATLWLLHTLLEGATADHPREHVGTCVGAMSLTVLLMTAVLHATR